MTIQEEKEKQLTEAMRAANKKFVEADRNIKDDPEAIRVLEKYQEEYAQLVEERYNNSSVSGHLHDFIDGITESVSTPPTSTGFWALDKELGGGLYEGLYAVGAVTSLGKTSLVLQIADQIAQSGKDVIIFSLEMARSELMAKSISRHTLQYVEANGLSTNYAKTNRGITNGISYKGYSKKDKEVISEAIREYSKYTDHLYIYEGIADIGVKQIRDVVEKHTKIKGSAPVVIVDYLQILAPADYRLTDKQATDRNIVEMKRLSRDYKIPVIGISSFNRDNYKKNGDNKGAVTLEAFKESGAIEYTSDVVIGLQFAGAGEKDFDLQEAKQKMPREIELVILKNRNGRSWGKVDFTYYPLFNAFEETTNADDVEDIRIV